MHSLDACHQREPFEKKPRSIGTGASRCKEEDERDFGKPHSMGRDNALCKGVLQTSAHEVRKVFRYLSMRLSLSLRGLNGLFGLNV